MDYVQQLDIELEKTAFYAGDIIRGNVLLENEENVKIRGVRVYLRGKGHTEWRIIRSGERRVVKDDQQYLDDRTTVWGVSRKEEAENIPILHRGKHRWPFEFHLPETGLPYSFESRFCTIRYYLRVVVDIPYASNPNTMRFFTIVAPYTDCMDERFLVPETARARGRTCACLPCLKPRALAAVLERQAYCSGEHLRLKCQVDNGSERPLCVLVQLVQTVDFYITKGVLGVSKQATHRALSYRSEAVKPHSSVELALHQQLRIPPVPPTLHTELCKLLQVRYMLRVSLVDPSKCRVPSGDNSEHVGASGGRRQLSVDLPLVIATQPFRVPNSPSPLVEYRRCVETVEGGNYVSTQFRLGQVYDGRTETEGDEDVLLYQPVYPYVVGHSLSTGNDVADGSSRTLEEKVSEKVSTV